MWMLKAQDKAGGHQKSSGIRFPTTKRPSRLVGEPEPCTWGPPGEATPRPCVRRVPTRVTKAAVHLLLHLHFVSLFFFPRPFPFRIKTKCSVASRDVTFLVTTPRHSFCCDSKARQGALTPPARRPWSVGAAGTAPCPPARVLTVLTEGSSPARAARAGSADVVTGSPVVTLTLVPTAQPEPSFRAL